MHVHYDLIVLGSGPAGKRAAIQAAKIGKSVLLVENNEIVGGVTVHNRYHPQQDPARNRPVPVWLALARHLWLQLQGYRGRSQAVPDLELGHEIEIIQHQPMRNGVEIEYGHARFVDEHTISVEQHDGLINQFTADYFVICVGTRTHRPDNVPFDGEAIIDSDEILHLKRIPKKLLVVGGGVIGVEYATIFKALDIEVTVLETMDFLLGFVDRDIVDELIHLLRDCNIQVRLGDQISTINKFDDGKVVVKFKSGKSMAVDTVLFAAGRQGVTDDLALEKVGIEADKRGRIPVNQDYQTIKPHIYAAGDVVGFPSLASTSMEQ